MSETRVRRGSIAPGAGTWPMTRAIRERGRPNAIPPRLQPAAVSRASATAGVNAKSLGTTHPLGARATAVPAPPPTTALAATAAIARTNFTSWTLDRLPPTVAARSAGPSYTSVLNRPPLKRCDLPELHSRSGASPGVALPAPGRRRRPPPECVRRDAPLVLEGHSRLARLDPPGRGLRLRREQCQRVPVHQWS